MFWQAYPKKAGKTGARRAFDQVLKKNRATVEQLIAAARRSRTGTTRARSSLHETRARLAERWPMG